MNNVPPSETANLINSDSSISQNSSQRAQSSTQSIQSQTAYLNGAQQQQISNQQFSQIAQNNLNQQPMSNQRLYSDNLSNHPMINPSYVNMPTANSPVANLCLKSTLDSRNSEASNYAPPQANLNNNTHILRPYVPPLAQSNTTASYPGQSTYRLPTYNSNQSQYQSYGNSPTPITSPSHYQNYQDYAIRYRPDPEFESIFSEMKNNQIVDNDHGFTKEFFQEWWYQAIGRGSGTAYYISNLQSNPSVNQSSALVQTMNGGRARINKSSTPSTQEVIDITSDDSDIEGVISNQNNNVNIQDKLVNFTIAKYDTTVSQQSFVQERYQITNKLYELYNSTIFEDKLPKDLKICWVNNLNRTSAKHTYENTRYIGRNSIMCEIQLSSKVVNSIDRLKNTLIHHLCHLAARLIDGDKTSTHSINWINWAQKASNIHPDLHITLDHFYD